MTPPSLKKKTETSPGSLDFLEKNKNPKPYLDDPPLPPHNEVLHPVPRQVVMGHAVDGPPIGGTSLVAGLAVSAALAAA